MVCYVSISSQYTILCQDNISVYYSMSRCHLSILSMSGYIQSQYAMLTPSISGYHLSILSTISVYYVRIPYLCQDTISVCRIPSQYTINHLSILCQDVRIHTISVYYNTGCNMASLSLSLCSTSTRLWHLLCTLCWRTKMTVRSTQPRCRLGPTSSTTRTPWSNWLGERGWIYSLRTPNSQGLCSTSVYYLSSQYIFLVYYTVRIPSQYVLCYFLCAVIFRTPCTASDKSLAGRERTLASNSSVAPSSFGSSALPFSPLASSTSAKVRSDLLSQPVNTNSL